MTREEVVVGVDRRRQGRPRLVAGDAGVVELRDGRQRAIEAVVVAPDPLEHSLVGGRRHEVVGRLARRRPELRQGEGDRLRRREPSVVLRSELFAPVRLAAPGSPPTRNAEQLPQLVRLRLQRPVGGRSELERAEPFRRARSPGRGSAVRAPRRGRAARRSRGTRRAASCARSPARARPRGRVGCPSRGRRRLRAWAAPQASSCVTHPVTAEQRSPRPSRTISHLPLIFCTLWSTPTTFTTFPVLTSM